MLVWFIQAGALSSGIAYIHVCTWQQNPSPSYNVSALQVPMALFTGSKDWLADPRDVAGLLPKLKETGKLVHHKNIDYYDHFDFIWGLDAPTVVYKDILSMASATWLGLSSHVFLFCVWSFIQMWLNLKQLKDNI